MVEEAERFLDDSVQEAGQYRFVVVRVPSLKLAVASEKVLRREAGQDRVFEVGRAVVAEL